MTDGSQHVSKHWQQSAASWDQVGPPLRPSEQDVAAYNHAIGGWCDAFGPPCALILGVTPELYHLSWPDGTDLLAIDHNPAMIDHVWPGPKDLVRCTSWLAMGEPAKSRDLVLCDGGFHLLPHPAGQQALVQALKEIVTPQGRVVLRLFAPPAQPESTASVLGALHAGDIANLNLLKLRLGMSLLTTSDAGVELAQVWRCLQEAAPDFEALAQRIGWPLAHLMQIDTYRDSKDRYYFVTADQVTQLFCEEVGGFTLLDIRTPSYALGQRCPLIIFERNDDHT